MSKNKISVFIKIFIAALLTCNVPFVFFGLYLGWPAALFAAFFHSIIKKITVIKSFILNIISGTLGAIVCYYLLNLQNISLLEFIRIYFIFGAVTITILSLLAPILVNYEFKRVKYEQK